MLLICTDFCLQASCSMVSLHPERAERADPRVGPQHPAADPQGGDLGSTPGAGLWVNLLGLLSFQQFFLLKKARLPEGWWFVRSEGSIELTGCNCKSRSLSAPSCHLGESRNGSPRAL